VSRILVYIMFILLVSALGFVIAVPPELQPQNRDSRRLDAFLAALQSAPKSIVSVRLVNGKSHMSYTMADNIEHEQSTVVPIEWKGHLIQQLIEKQIPFTVRDPDYTWAIVAVLAAVGVGYFRFGMLPRWSERTCPFCSERVHCSAKICRFCRSELLPISLEFGPRAASEDDDDDDEADDDTDDDDDDSGDDGDDDGPTPGEHVVPDGSKQAEERALEVVAGGVAV
jgi:hypothetical protein